MIARLLGACALVAASLVLLGPAPAAHACSCVISTPAEQARRAEAVFTGTVTHTEGSPRTSRTVAYHVAVDKVWKGEVADEIRVVTGSQSSACGLPGLPEGQPVIWFASTDGIFFRDEDGEGAVPLGVNSCSGTGEVSAKTVRAVTAALGDPGAPVPAEASDGQRIDTDEDAQAVWWPWLIPVGVLALGGSAAYVVVRRRRP